MLLISYYDPRWSICSDSHHIRAKWNIINPHHSKDDQYEVINPNQELLRAKSNIITSHLKDFLRWSIHEVINPNQGFLLRATVLFTPRTPDPSSDPGSSPWNNTLWKKISSRLFLGDVCEQQQQQPITTNNENNNNNHQPLSQALIWLCCLPSTELGSMQRSTWSSFSFAVSWNKTTLHLARLQIHIFQTTTIIFDLGIGVVVVLPSASRKRVFSRAFCCPT